MKLYDCTTAPSPRRVRIFLAEKGVAVPRVEVDLRGGAHLRPEFKAVNPYALVPVLELDDGTRICESVAICRYFEELYPDPPLMGADPKDKALVEMWNRCVEFDGYLAVMEAFRNAAPGLKGRALPGADEPVEQIPDLAERGRASARRFFRRLDGRLAQSRFIAGERYSIADITALVTVDFAARIKLAVPEELASLARWYREVAARPSAKA